MDMQRQDRPKLELHVCQYLILIKFYVLVC